MKETLYMGFTTVGSEAEAQRLAHELVDQGLAACVQIEAGVASVYRWRGEVHSDVEWRLLIKFAAAQSAEVGAFIAANHPYDVPQWFVVRAEEVGTAYLKWALEQTGA